MKSEIDSNLLTFNHEYTKKGFRFYGFSDLDDLHVNLYQYHLPSSNDDNSLQENNSDYKCWIMEMEYRCSLQSNLDKVQPQLELFASYFGDHVKMSKLELGCII